MINFHKTAIVLLDVQETLLLIFKIIENVILIAVERHLHYTVTKIHGDV